MKYYCCQMRARFLISIARENRDAPQPDNLCDFVLDWERKPKPLIGIKFCPFCGKPLQQDQILRDIPGS